MEKKKVKRRSSAFRESKRVLAGDVARAEDALYLRERAALTSLSVWDKGGRSTEAASKLLVRLQHSARLVRYAREDVARAKRAWRRGGR